MVPDLVTIFTTPPSACPYSAEYELACTRNSSTASGLARVTRPRLELYVFSRISKSTLLASAPSTRKCSPPSCRNELAPLMLCCVAPACSTMPGTSASSSTRSRPFMGSAFTCCELTTPPSVVEAVSTSGAFPVMVTVSRTVPGSSLIVTFNRSATPSVRLSSTSTLNPAAVTEMRYTPTGITGAKKLPLESVSNFKAWFVPALRISTEAFGTTAPDESVTVPRMLALSCCAKTNGVTSPKSKTNFESDIAPSVRERSIVWDIFWKQSVSGSFAI